jgi:hypothetical protein
MATPIERVKTKIIADAVDGFQAQYDRKYGKAITTDFAALPAAKAVKTWQEFSAWGELRLEDFNRHGKWVPARHPHGEPQLVVTKARQPDHYEIQRVFPGDAIRDVASVIGMTFDAAEMDAIETLGWRVSLYEGGEITEFYAHREEVEAW